MNKKILAVAEIVSNEKSLPKEKIFEVLENALTIATQKKYEQKINIRVKINRDNGSFHTYRRWLVVKNVQEPTKEITLEAANYQNKNIQLGEFIEYKIPSILFDRIATQTVKKIIIQKIQIAKQILIINKLKNKIGSIISGNIKQINKNYILIDIGHNIEAYLHKTDMITKEHWNIGNPIKGVLYHIYKEHKKYKLLISRSKIEMLIALLNREIPEIKENIIIIKSITRDPGNRAKIAVSTKNKYIDPIGACIGIRGTRIQAISKELSGEKIDIILWSHNIYKYIINAMLPATISIINIIKKKKIIDISVNTQNIAKAIGKKGQNIKLASQLTGWTVHICIIKPYHKYKFNYIKKLVKYYIRKLNINIKIAFFLLKEHNYSLKHVYYYIKKKNNKLKNKYNKDYYIISNSIHDIYQHKKQNIDSTNF